MLFEQRKWLARPGFHRRSQSSPGGHVLPHFKVYLVILCFAKRRPEQRYCCSPKVKILLPTNFCAPKFWAGYATAGFGTKLNLLYIRDVLTHESQGHLELLDIPDESPQPSL